MGSSQLMELNGIAQFDIKTKHCVTRISIFQAVQFFVLLCSNEKHKKQEFRALLKKETGIVFLLFIKRVSSCTKRLRKPNNSQEQSLIVFLWRHHVMKAIKLVFTV